MIEELTIRGYRSLKDVTWRPGRLNLIIGPNGSGKSNLLRALETLSQSSWGKLDDTIISDGGFQSVSWDSNTSAIEFKVDAKLYEQVANKHSYSILLRALGRSVSYQIDREKLTEKLKAAGRSNPIVLLSCDGNKAFYRGPRLKSLLSYEHYNNEPGIESVLSTLGNNDLHAESQIFRSWLRTWQTVYGIRTDFRADIRSSPVASVASRITSDGQNLVSVLHTLYSREQQFKDDIDDAMRAAFGVEYLGISFPPAADQRIQLRLRWHSLNSSRSNADLSDGTLRFLILVAVLANPNPPPLIAIDEPETGLHPGMFPIIADLAAQAARKSQVVFTTHSSEFLDAFSEMEPTTTVMNTENGASSITNIDGEELARWLKEYRLGSLFRSGELESMA